MATGEAAICASDLRAPRLGSGLLGEARLCMVVQVYSRGVTDGGGEGLPYEYVGVLFCGVVGRAGAGMGIGLERAEVTTIRSDTTSVRGKGISTGEGEREGEREGGSHCAGGSHGSR